MKMKSYSDKPAAVSADIGEFKALKHPFVSFNLYIIRCKCANKCTIIMLCRIRMIRMTLHRARHDDLQKPHDPYDGESVSYHHYLQKSTYLYDLMPIFTS